MDKLRILYQNFISLKKYFWTHCLMALGWIVFIPSFLLGLIGCLDHYIIGLFFASATTYYFTKFVVTFLGIPILLLIIIETGIKEFTNFNNNSPHAKFISNHIYNIFWTCGICLFILEVLYYST